MAKAATTIKTSAAASSSTVAPKAPAPSTALNSGSKPNPKPKKKVTEVEDCEDDGDKIRGYKTTSDGRKTTFFNNEMDEMTKNLIGDIAPKKIDSSVNTDVLSTTGNGSAWNSAGTYEEKIVTPWAEAYLKDNLGRVMFQVADVPGFLTIQVHVDSVTLATGGLAQVTMNRGKRKPMADFCVDPLTWTMVATEAGVGKKHTLTGSLSL